MKFSIHLRLTNFYLTFKTFISLVRYISFLSAFFLLNSCGESEKSTKSVNPTLPNVVLLMGDDHGWDETAYNGHPFLQTPVLDEMAATGFRMNRFYSASPVCSPTRGSVITGRYPNRYGTFSANWSIRPEEISIANIMKKAGYATAHFGKWHLGPVKEGVPTNPGAMGFDEWLSHDNFFELDPYLSRNGADPELYEGESSEILIAEAIKFIDKHPDKPWFIVIWYGSPHEPYSGLAEDLALYDEIPGHYNHQTTKLTSNETGASVVRPMGDVLRERFAEITAMDRSLGQLRSFFKKQGLQQNTLLWYFGDNGTPAGQGVTIPFRGAKGKVYEGGIRVPCVIEWPAMITSPFQSEFHAVSSDVLPTLCDIVGEPLPNRPIDGISLLPLMQGKIQERPSPIGFWYGKMRQADDYEPIPYIDPALQTGTSPLVKLMGGSPYRTFKNYHHPDIREEDYQGPRAWLDNQFKLVIHENEDGSSLKELFDIKADSAETNNIIHQFPDIAQKMEEDMKEWQFSVLESLTGKDYH
ncbi:MAG: sulfatase-like hydrolase/transferase [Cyclobacteriaceae bacterium]|nr:sulfatase-like hydrolase/transferase [Cyclobacteriaceae bacterium]